MMTGRLCGFVLNEDGDRSTPYNAAETSGLSLSSVWPGEHTFIPIVCSKGRFRKLNWMAPANNVHRWLIVRLTPNGITRCIFGVRYDSAPSYWVITNQRQMVAFVFSCRYRLTRNFDTWLCRIGNESSRTKSKFSMTITSRNTWPKLKLTST